MQTITQDKIDVGSLVLFHVGAIPYAGVVLSVISPVVTLVRVQTKDGPKIIEIGMSELSAR